MRSRSGGLRIRNGGSDGYVLGNSGSSGGRLSDTARSDEVLRRCLLVRLCHLGRVWGNERWRERRVSGGERKKGWRPEPRGKGEEKAEKRRFFLCARNSRANGGTF